MRKLMKKAVAVLLVMTVTFGAAQTAEAKNPVFNNKYSHTIGPRAKVDYSGYHYHDEDLELGFTYGKTEQSCYNNKNEVIAVAVNQGTNIYAWMNIPKEAKVKSVTLKSSNPKVIKVTNKKKGLLKAKKIGKATLSFTVKWTCSKTAKPFGGKSPLGLSKLSKKGNTYTTQLKIKYGVLCKKNAHKYSDWKVTRKADCEDYGEQERKCSTCGAKEFKQIEPAGHNYDPVTHKCTVCGDKDENFGE